MKREKLLLISLKVILVTMLTSFLFVFDSSAAKPVSLVNSTSENKTSYIVTTPYDKAVVSENGMEFHYVAADTWQGLMVIIPDPSRVFVGTIRDKYDGQAGASATRIASRYGAIFGVNGAFFVDKAGNNNGGTPIGFVFSNGQMKYGSKSEVNNIIGLDKNNNLIVGRMSGQDAINMGIRDGVSCSPILVQNGAVGNLKEKSTTLMDARTCVGARADGAILILTVDGRMSHSIGATTASLAECMLSFGAVNAGNLDGGGSTSLYYAGPTALTGLTNLKGGRPSPEAICVLP